MLATLRRYWRTFKHWAFFKLITVLTSSISGYDLNSMQIITLNGVLTLVTAKNRLPVLRLLSNGGMHYVLTPVGSFVLAGERAIAKPTKLHRADAVPQYVYRFGAVHKGEVHGTDLFSFKGVEEHLTSHTFSKGSRFISTTFALSGIYHFLGKTAQLVGKSFEEFVASKQAAGRRLIKISTAKCPGCWNDLSVSSDRKLIRFAQADRELTLDGFIPQAAIVAVGIINPERGYIEWEGDPTPEYPVLSDEALDLIYPE